MLVHNTLVGLNLRDQVRIGASGKIISWFDVARTLALGADWCNSARGLLLFGGRGKISELMGDFAKGIKSFMKGLTEEEKADTEPVKTDPKTIDHQPAPAPTATAG